MKVVAVVCLVVAVAAVGVVRGDTHSQMQFSSDAHAFEAFKTQFERSYETQEEHAYRFMVFSANMQRAKMMNDREDEAVFGMTKYSDLTPEEFRDQLLMSQTELNANIAARRASASVADLSAIDNIELPDTFDWRDSNAVTPVKNQGDCGSCWAFSTTENIESVWNVEAKQKLTELSVAQIVDCDGKDDGCNGGDLPTAYNYVIKAGGLESEQDYPYHPSDGKCEFDPSKIVAKIDSWEYVSRTKNETAMQVYVHEKAPISICVDAEPWQFYTGGILRHNCGKQLDHCVQLVGWGKTSVPYWIVRNSWGSDWGIDGYIYIERDQDLCGIAKEPASAIASPP